jgi:hypothetical protein
MICGIQPPFIVSWNGIAPVRMYSGYCRHWQRIDIRSTQRYLRMTPELLHEASRRFAIYSGQEIDHE